VLVRTRRDGLCNTGQSPVDCTGGITRYVWAGDNLLWEMRGPGADSVAGWRLNERSAKGPEFGEVGYTHAGGVDRPLVVWKGNVVVVPHANWRGVFGRGTNPDGTSSTVPIEWPGFKTTAYHRMGPSQQATKNWMGSLIGGHRDPGGAMYMRNRYYDPQTGQFTQTDPIGIAGGLNTYGFANGDPVRNWDPFGTCAWGIGPDAAHGRCSGMEPQDEWAESSSCRQLGCRLRHARPEEKRWVLNRLNTLRTDIPFCNKVRDSGVAMVERQLGMYDNWVEDEHGDPVWGNGPYHLRLGGPVMYLSSQLYRRRGGQAVVHEAIHGLINTTRAIQGDYYADGSTTELGLSLDQTALVCNGRRPYP
jgi:RHS repeat-associated protein